MRTPQACLLALLMAMVGGAAANETQLTELPPAALLGPAGFESAAATVAGEPFELLGQQIPAGERRQLNWQIEATMGAVAIPTPILVAHGQRPGPVLCLTAAVHGDELNGVEVVRQILFDIKPTDLAGTVIGVPIVNASGYLRGSRYLPDRRDLNRFFPGSSSGSLASRFAKAVFDTIITRCSALVDMHTGSFQRINLPQLRADLTVKSVADFSRQFGAIAVLHGAGPKGSLRRAATDVGIPAVTLEAGEASRFNKSSVDASVEAIQSLLNRMSMAPRFRLFGEPQPAFYDSVWVRANSGGILFSQIELGELVKKGQILGTVTDPIRNDQTVLSAPFTGRILGMAVNQVVMPGFAAYHIGSQASEEEAIADAIAGPGKEANAKPEPPPGDDGDPADPGIDSDSVEMLNDPMAPLEKLKPANDEDTDLSDVGAREPSPQVSTVDDQSLETMELTMIEVSATRLPEMGEATKVGPQPETPLLQQSFETTRTEESSAEDTTAAEEE
ncbi:MAG: succinylglutamate desuccinylase/aspartoacylase family protein [Pseudomonadota bacterium]